MHKKIRDSLDAGKIKIKISREKFLVPGCYLNDPKHHKKDAYLKMPTIGKIKKKKVIGK